MPSEKAAMQAEVRRAVRDYLDTLISQRTGAGKGMAISANDLLVAARTAGQQANREDANNMLGGIAQTGMRVIRDAPKDSRVPRSKHTTTKPAPPTKHRSQYHWMVWKTTPTPTPVTPTPLSDTPLPVPIAPPAEPRPLEYKPVLDVAPTNINLAPTPISIGLPTPTPMPIALNSPTPEPFKTPAFDLSANIGPPNAVEITPPAPTPAVHWTPPTPVEMKADYRDPLSDAQVMPVHTQAESAAFKPVMKAWVNNTNDHDRKVAFDMFKAMNGGRSISSAASRSLAPSRLSIDNLVNMPCTPRSSHSARAVTPAAGPTTVQTAGVRTSVPMFSQRYPDLEERYLKKLQKSFDSQERGETPHPPSQQARAHSSMSYTRTQQYRPRSTASVRPRYPARLPSPKEYIHESSFFMNSQVPFERDFIINPEWVSEIKTRRRQQRDALAKRAARSNGCHCACAK